MAVGNTETAFGNNTMGGGTGSANIRSVDYTEIPNYAKEIRSCAQAINDALISAFNNLREMHKHWTKDSYKGLVNQFNEKIETLYEFEKFIAAIPYTLEVVANNYSLADNGNNVVSASNEEPTKIGEIEQFDDKVFTFISSSVNSSWSAIDGNFSTVEDNLGTIQIKLDNLPWDSDAADQTKAQLTKWRGEIATCFENLRSSFKTAIEAAQTTMSEAETANTLSSNQ